MKKILARTIKLAATAVFLTSGLSFTAHAGLVGVKSIQISSAYTGSDAYVQVAEVSAYNMAGDNVALESSNATASAPVGYDSTHQPGTAIDGSFSNGQYFLSGSASASEVLTIEFGSVQELNFFSIWGRTDAFSYRDIYNVSFFDLRDGLLQTTELTTSGQNLNSASLEFANAQVVPEPGSLALFGLGLAGLAAVGRKRKA